MTMPMQADSGFAPGDVLCSLDRQFEDYKSMQQVTLEQGRSIANEDLPGLSVSFERMRRLMDQIRIRQASLPEDLGLLEARDASVASRLEAIREIVRELLESRKTHEHSVRRLMRQSQSELKMLGRGQRAARQYQNRFVEDARFFDGTR